MVWFIMHQYKRDEEEVHPSVMCFFFILFYLFILFILSTPQTTGQKTLATHSTFIAAAAVVLFYVSSDYR
jgi:exosortase/archaeosortase